MRRNIQKTQEPPLTGAEVERYLKAVPYVKGQPYARISYARWLLGFAACDLTKLSPAEWSDLRWQAIVFAYNPGPGNAMLRAASLPNKTAVQVMQGWVQKLWPDLQKAQPVILPASSRSMLAYSDGRFVRIFLPHWDPWPIAFAASVGELLTDPEVAPRIRFCLQCHKPFCANKRQTYCSGSCSLTHRTYKWRKQNPERFRAARREAYQRKVKAKLGGAVRVGTRSTGVRRSPTTT